MQIAKLAKLYYQLILFFRPKKCQSIHLCSGQYFQKFIIWFAHNSKAIPMCSIFKFHSIFTANKASWKYLIIDYIWFFVTLKYRCNLLVLGSGNWFSKWKRKGKSHAQKRNTVSSPIQNIEQFTKCTHELPSVLLENNYFGILHLHLFSWLLLRGRQHVLTAKAFGMTQTKCLMVNFQRKRFPSIYFLRKCKVDEKIILIHSAL